jgi:hypothetical protein
MKRPPPSTIVNLGRDVLQVAGLSVVSYLR